MSDSATTEARVLDQVQEGGEVPAVPEKEDLGTPKVLVVEDEAGTLSVLASVLKKNGFDVTPALGGKKAMDLLADQVFDLVLTDIRMAPVDGMELLRHAKAIAPDTVVILLTGHGTVETAVEAMKAGAYDYVTKPFKVDDLLITIRRALDYRRVVAENVHLRAELDSRVQFENMVAESPAMRMVCDRIHRVATTDQTVLIQGESGTGKELVARAIHRRSLRRDAAFLPINCAALPENLLESEMFGHVKGAFTGATTHKKGLFEEADKGTIFLDEINSMPMSIQGKLLRVLQEGEIRKVGGTQTVQVDVRVLVASNSSLEAAIERGEFREDLYYRLSVIPLDIPPLRERAEDIMPLAYTLMRRQVGRGVDLPAVPDEVRRVLEGYAWPGNVRELENAIKHALTFMVGNTLTIDVLPSKVARGEAGGSSRYSPEEIRSQSLKAFLRKQELEYVGEVMRFCEGDKEKAANLLKVSLTTLYRKLPLE